LAVDWQQRTQLCRDEKRQKHGVDENVRLIVEAQPIWFSAAILLQTRLNRFCRDIMKQDEPEIATILNIPAALRYVLLVAPPFQYCGKYLLPQHKLWSQNSPLHNFDWFHLAKKKNELFWFAHNINSNRNYHRCIALYSGVCYVKSDQNTEKMGIAVESIEHEKKNDGHEAQGTKENGSEEKNKKNKNSSNSIQ